MDISTSIAYKNQFGSKFIGLLFLKGTGSTMVPFMQIQTTFNIIQSVLWFELMNDI